MRIVLFLFVFMGSSMAFGQGASDEEKIIKQIQFFFDGMRSADTTGMSQMLMDEVTLTSYFKDKEGVTQKHNGSMTEFVTALAQPRDQVWDERIHSYEIKIDGPLGIAWTSYSFYLDETLLHCGVNVFQFVHIDDTWKIAGITDTRRKEGCL